MLVICNNCSSQFEKDNYHAKHSLFHYCSRSCSASKNNLGKQKNKPINRTCKMCNNLFYKTGKHKSESYCQGCIGDNTFAEMKTIFNKTLTIGHFKKKSLEKNYHPSWAFAEIRGFNRQWNKELLKLPCLKCKYNIHVELAHIKSISSFSDETTLEEVNNSKNILPLCPNCHYEFDNGLLTLEEILNKPLPV